MISPKIKALFEFIEFLNSNIENFSKYDEVKIELDSLLAKRKGLKPNNNYLDKIEFDKIQVFIEEKGNLIIEKIINVIRDKFLQLEISEWDETFTNLYNYNIGDILELRRTFHNEDLNDIFNYKKLYLEYRTNPNSAYFQTLFFEQLDEILKELFDYFKDTNQNEFEAIEDRYDSFSNYVNRSLDNLKIEDFEPPLKNQIDVKPLSLTEKKYYTKHHVLTFLIEYHALGMTIPRGNKVELERLGNVRMGKGKGNTFYKVFNNLENTDLNKQSNLISIGGLDWRNTVLELSKFSDEIDKYLISKEL